MSKMLECVGRAVPVLLPDKNSASGYRIEYLSIHVDEDLAKILDSCDEPMIGKYRADYSPLTPEEIAQPDPDLAELDANSVPVTPAIRGGE